MFVHGAAEVSESRLESERHPRSP